jgi:hypothetical protein
VGKNLSNYGLVVNKNQRHPRYNNWYSMAKWSQERQEENAILLIAPLSKFNIFDDKGNNIGYTFDDNNY